MTSIVKAGVTLDYDWFPRPLPSNVIIGEKSWIATAYSFLHYRSRRPVGLQIGRGTGVYSDDI